MNLRIVMALVMVLASATGLGAHSGKTTPVLAALARYHESLMKNPNERIDTRPLVKLLRAGGDSKTATKAFAAAVSDAEALGAARTGPRRLEAYARLVEKLAPLHGHHDGSGTNVFYCPMAKKKWVARGTQVRNPYMADMRACGSIAGH